jgi:predicted MFS family arabinose efflux permease
LTVAFPAGRQRDVALGIWGGLAGLGGTLGVIIGGVLVDSLSWRWIFFVNVPLIAAILVLAPLVLTESRAPQRAGRVDVAGPFLATTGLLSLVLGIIRTDALGWGSSEVVTLLVAATVLLGAFFVVEGRHRHPMLPLSVFRSRGLSLGSLMLALNGAAILSVFFLNTTFLQLVRGTSALGAGLDFLPMGAGAILGAVIAGQVVTRAGTRPVQLVGAALTSLGLYWLLGASVSSSYFSTLFVGFALFGAGITTLGVPTQIGAVADIAHHNAGVSSGVLSAAYQVGGALGLAVVTTLTTSRITHLALGGAAMPSALTGGYHLGIALALGLAVGNGAIALASPSVRPTPEMVRSAAG